MSKADEYTKLRNLNRRIDSLGAQEDEAVAAVRARYAEKNKRLRAERSVLLTAVKGDEKLDVQSSGRTAEAIASGYQGSKAALREPSGADDSELMA